ncbi:nucleoside/nucleotide kinase family protein [Deinococcus detaillensis]|uniref:Nucleoside/nucleotide kinase family protein n=1 Tax=Deinococcus detaillensis TaxID=2592048 RepID=A0A553V4N2_9DEIO|nr:nucleoside/nucleotide kinase family protein [Deinococcus detaillensis]TSA87419.1 nucleoside/nucleotide kinase family protein [Deinococcus detaillensis]
MDTLHPHFDDASGSPVPSAASSAAQPRTTADLIALARALLKSGERRILGITGAPGAGKSTVCAAIAGALGDQVAVVGMDGFHLANSELIRLGRRERKGAPDTFDADGYAALLERLWHQTEEVIYAPTFERTIEESIGSALPILASTPLILTEGNYLLLEGGAWSRVKPQLDAVWFLEPPEELRLSRLIARHVAFGKAPDAAKAWVERVDQNNAALINAGRSRADLIIRLVD